MTDFYLHDLNPVLLHLWGPLSIRWYGLAYLGGFIATYFLMRRFSRTGRCSIPARDLENFIVMMALFGVFLGGRLGYVLVYGWRTLLHDPLYIFRLWEGGMASHGGLVGVILFCLWYAQRHQIPFLNLTDCLSMAAPIGLFFGRLANFINGELWGRPSTVPWAVIFPQEAGLTAEQVRTQYDLGWLIGEGYLTPRHPSQLYEAAVEGLLLLAILLTANRLPWFRRDGRISALFLVAYGIGRVAVECFREPDSALVAGAITKGQFLSLVMVVGGLLLFYRSSRQGRKA
ncbi:MAG: prolipoprotein diacylglyceryl transferase [Kiritimatiellae bacterium]|nr:prolipoprotein diacylglyceryl transferase [Kiritimatiellia bacterium]MCB1102375.1 prolipoprotein diacylglyceryl transferase [Kiritimatiellia bacterium]